MNFYDQINSLKIGEQIEKDSISFEDLFLLKYPPDIESNAALMFFWRKLKVYAKHKNIPVRVWMVSRFGDVGITDKIENPIGYDTRIDPKELHSWVIEKIK